MSRHSFTVPVLLAFALACSSVSVDVGQKGSNTDSRLRTLEKAKNIAVTAKNYKSAWSEGVEAVTPDDERRLGQSTSLVVIKALGGLELRDDALLLYLNRVGNHIAVNGKGTRPRQKSRRFFFGILKNPVPGAVSTPGGHVFVTTGLLERLNSESELAFVLAHEMAHVDLEHGLEALKGAAGFDGFVKKALVEKIEQKTPVKVGTLFQDVDLVRGAALYLADPLVRKKNESAYGAAQESAADLKAVEYLNTVGYESAAGVRVLEMLADLRDDAAERSRSHGSPNERIEKIAKKVHADGKAGYTRWQTEALPHVLAKGE